MNFSSFSAEEFKFTISDIIEVLNPEMKNALYKKQLYLLFDKIVEAKNESNITCENIPVLLDKYYTLLTFFDKMFQRVLLKEFKEKHQYKTTIFNNENKLKEIKTRFINANTVDTTPPVSTPVKTPNDILFMEYTINTLTELLQIETKSPTTTAPWEEPIWNNSSHVTRFPTRNSTESTPAPYNTASYVII
jgi:hypothetical protein